MATLDQDRIAQLIAAPRSEEPVLSLYLRAWGGDRKATLKNLIKEGEAGIAGDTGWNDERKKAAKKLLEQLGQRADSLIVKAPPKGRGTHALFFSAEAQDELRLPVDLRDRIVIDRTPYASPLSSLIDQFERYGVILCDQKKAHLFEVYLREVEEGWETVESDHERHRGRPAGGPARSATKGAGNFHGLEELRRRNHADYLLHQHLAQVADLAFRRFKQRPFERLILAGNKEVLPLLEEHLHSYLKQRVVAKEPMAVDLTRDQAREKVIGIETRVEEEKERQLLQDLKDARGGSGLGVSGLDDTLRALFFGKVRTLVIEDEHQPLLGRECPECRFLFERPEDKDEKTPTLVECPVCQRSTRRVPDIIDEAVELAILSGARVEHVAYAKDDLLDLGGVAALLRFK